MQPPSLPGIRDPLATLAGLGLSLPTGGLVSIILGIVFAIWLIYTLVVIYHWVRYSHAALIAYPAIFVHLVVSMACMSYALSGSTIPTT